MDIDILGIEPSKVVKSVKGKYICIYGLPKVGKTTLATQFPKPLLCGFEHGWNCIGGVKALDINKWTDFKVVIQQLKEEKAKEMYETIIIDTVDLAWDACESYICSQNQVSKIGDIPWGAGYSALKKEFSKALKTITQLGYGLVIIAQIDIGTLQDDKGQEISTYKPSIPKKAYSIINRLVDLIGFIDIQYNPENGKTERFLQTKPTYNIMAGTRLKYLKERIPFGYKELSDAVVEAIEREEEFEGCGIITEAEQDNLLKENSTEIELSFNDIKNRIKVVWDKLLNVESPEQQKDNVLKIKSLLKDVFGDENIRISTIEENQKDLLKLFLYYIEQL